MKKPPEHLSEEARSWWRKLAREYGIVDQAGLLLLETGLEAFDRLRDCQRVIASDGPTFIDKAQQPKPHPLLAAERDARSQLLAALKALNFDLEPLKDVPGRRQT